MVNITIAVPIDLKSKMDQYEEINWSAVARFAFDEKIKELDFVETIKEQSGINAIDKKILRKFGKRK